MNKQISVSPFRLGQSFRPTRLQPLDRVIAKTVEKTTGLRKLESLYHHAENATSYAEFTRSILDGLGVTHNLDNQVESIPATGSAIVIANHPFGIIDGVILANVLLKIRPDVKILTNHLLQRIPEVKDLFIGVDPFGGDNATRRNIQPILAATRWVKQGHLLLVFPSGEVSHLDIKKRQVADPLWSPTVGRIVRLTKAPVIPAYFSGSNSTVFQLAGLVHPRLRTALLPREVNNKAKMKVHGKIGSAITWDRLSACENDQKLIDYLRFRTYLLKDSSSATPAKTSVKFRPFKPKLQKQISDEVLTERLSKEVNALPSYQLLAKQNGMHVYYAKSEQIPWLMQEMGRLREATFRATGEGTGKAQDLDLFDNYYLQLFVWDHHAEKLVGAYRLGLTDQILHNYGIKGLYTHTLFKYREKIFAQMSPAIELGRSFVRIEYQRSFAPLMLLWKGIGTFIAQNPKYRTLFGPVSISNTYQTMSQKLLIEFLRQNHFNDDLARQIKPRVPFRHPLRSLSGQQAGQPELLHDIDNLSDMIAQIEQDQKGIPVLLKQYLKLGGRLLGFNVDRRFSNSIDGLIMVDLIQTDPRVLQRYMGKTAAEQFLNAHQKYNRA